MQAGSGETNMIDGKWRTEHLVEADCKAATPARRQKYAMDCFDYQSFGDYEDNPYDWATTSEDLNPNEGSK